MAAVPELTMTILHLQNLSKLMKLHGYGTLLSLTKRVGLRELSGQLSYILQKVELLTEMFPMSKTQTETRAI